MYMFMVTYLPKTPFMDRNIPVLPKICDCLRVPANVNKVLNYIKTDTMVDSRTVAEMSRDDALQSS